MSSITPVISVVLPTWNGLVYLREAVASVLSQTLSALELIVVDDGSTDGTSEWLRSVRDPRVQTIAEAHSGNLSFVRNRGIREASAPWICFMDADDVWEADKLEEQLAYHASHPGIRWSYTGRRLMDKSGALLPEENFKPWRPIGGWILLELLAHEAAIASPTLMIDRSLLTELGGLDERFRYAGDYEFFLRLALQAECGVIDHPLIRIRLHTGSRTHNRLEAVAALADVYRCFREEHAGIPEIQRTCRRQEAFYRAWVARRWAQRKEWGKAAVALRCALRLDPFGALAYRVAARAALDLIRSSGPSKELV